MWTQYGRWICLLFLCVVYIPALAQPSYKHTVYAGGAGGFTLPHGDVLSFGDREVHGTGGYSMHVHAMYEIGALPSLHLGYAYGLQFMSAVDQTSRGVPLAEGRTSLVQHHTIALRYRFYPSTISPYLWGGFGWSFLRVGRVADEPLATQSDPQRGIQWGNGFGYELGAGMYFGRYYTHMGYRLPTTFTFDEIQSKDKNVLSIYNARSLGAVYVMVGYEMPVVSYDVKIEASDFQFLDFLWSWWPDKLPSWVVFWE